MMTYKCCIVLAILVLIKSQSNSAIDESANINSEIEKSKEEIGLRQDFQRKLNPWVAEQLEKSSQNNQFQATQSFLLQLSPSQQHQFRHSTKIKKSNVLLKIRIFTQQSGDDIVIIKNPNQENRLQVKSKNNLSDQYHYIANIYLFKVVKLILQNGEVFIAIKNTHLIPIIVQIQIQGDPTRIDSQLIAKNDHFQMMAAKLEALYEEMKRTQSNRKRLYKWQWGFLERQQHYQQEMLKLTAAELIIIMITSIVQMYCIKALLENNRVV